MKKSIIALNVVVFLFLLGITGKVNGQGKLPDYKTVYHITIPDGCTDPTGYQVTITHHFSDGRVMNYPKTFPAGVRTVDITVSAYEYGQWATISTNIPGVTFEFFDGSIPFVNQWVDKYVTGFCSLDPGNGFGR